MPTQIKPVVFVVDDDPSVRKALERLLRSFGYRAETFESAEDFLESDPKPQGGCLLVDIRLPGMTGIDLVETLLSKGARYPVIFMTAHENPQWQESAKTFGAVAFLKKPFDERALIDAIELAFGKDS